MTSLVHAPRDAHTAPLMCLLVQVYNTTNSLQPDLLICHTRPNLQHAMLSIRATTTRLPLNLLTPLMAEQSLLDATTSKYGTVVVAALLCQVAACRLRCVFLLSECLQAWSLTVIVHSLSLLYSFEISPHEHALGWLSLPLCFIVPVSLNPRCIA